MKRKEYMIIGEHELTEEKVVLDGMGIHTKQIAKEMIKIFKLINPRLTYTIVLKETP